MKLETLFEGSFHKFEFKVTKRIIDKYVQQHSVSNFIGTTHGEYDDWDDDDIAKTPEFIKYINSYLEAKADDEWSDINDSIKNGKIVLYRRMSVRKNWVKHLFNNPNSRLGKYWSWSAGGAIAHWGKYNGSKYKDHDIVIEIKEKYVDWQQTFESSVFNDGEMEITLFKNTPIQIKELWMGHERLDISSIKNNRYKV